VPQVHQHQQYRPPEPRVYRCQAERLIPSVKTKKKAGHQIGDLPFLFIHVLLVFHLFDQEDDSCNTENCNC
jgi:hypothetical protein